VHKKIEKKKRSGKYQPSNYQTMLFDNAPRHGIWRIMLALACSTVVSAHSVWPPPSPAAPPSTVPDTEWSPEWREVATQRMNFGGGVSSGGKALRARDQRMEGESDEARRALVEWRRLNSCAAGRYSNTTGDSCVVCPGGTYQDESNHTVHECKKCKAGKYLADNKGTNPVFHASADLCLECSAGKNSQAGSSECSKPPAPTPPTSVTVRRLNDSSLLVSWVFGTTIQVKAQTLEVAISTERFFQDASKTSMFQDVSPDSTSVVVSDLPVPLWTQVYFARVRGVVLSNAGTWSSPSDKWIVGADCDKDNYLNDTMSDSPYDWACHPCPSGGSCGGGVQYNSIVPKFGWAVCPTQSPVPFQKCSFQAACLGGPNLYLLNKFKEEGQDDPANCVNNCTVGCNKAYRNDSQLCGACNSGFSHGDLSGKCDKCPETGSNTAIAVVGCVFAILGPILYVKLTMSDGGKVDSADGILSILLSFVQLVSLLTTFPIEW
jgi:hypothetical protein